MGGNQHIMVVFQVMFSFIPYIFLYVIFAFFFFLIGPHLQHMEVLRLGVELELQLLA